VERSADGANFTTIGSLKGSTFNNFTDLLPGAINYYRIKDVDKQGRTTYSRTVAIESVVAYGVDIYPNPAERMMQVRINLATKTKLALIITDMTGRVQYRQVMSLDKGSWNREVDVSHWPAQIYLVRIRNLQTGVESVQKLMKM
jgi:hypothetical protein